MFWGIDLGGTRIKLVILDDSLHVTARHMVPTGDGHRHDGRPAFADTIRRMLREAGTKPAGIGLSAPGLVSPDGRSIACMPGRMQGLVGLDWASFLSFDGPVPVMNDGHAALMGEWKAGAAKNLSHAYLLTLGTGVGGAILAGGRILRGFLGRAGHLGHITLDRHGPPGITGTPGSLEDAIGNHNISQRSHGRFTSTRSLLDAVHTGDPGAARLWNDSLHALACAIISLNNVLDPEAVIIGGGIAEAGDTLFLPLARHIATMDWRPTGRTIPLLPAQLGEWAGAIGAAFQAAEPAPLPPPRPGLR